MLIIDALIAAVLLVLDQFTKHLAVVHLKNQPAYVIIDGVLELQYLENRGYRIAVYCRTGRYLFCFVGRSYFLRCCIFLFSNFRKQRNFRIVACIAGSGCCRRHRQHDRQIPSWIV